MYKAVPIFGNFPANIYLFQIAIETIEKGVKYNQS